MNNNVQKSMSEFKKKVDDLLSAVTFAEAGEFATARTIMSEGRKVLLAVKESRIDSKTLKYALNTSKRIGADLDVLHVTAPDNNVITVDSLLLNFVSELKTEGIVYRMITRTGCLKQQIIDYTNSETDILFVVIESPHSLDVDCNEKDKEISKLWQKLKCPLVVVMDGAKA